MCPSETLWPTCCIIACKYSLKLTAFWPWRDFSYSLEWMEVEQPVKFQTALGQVWRPAINSWPSSLWVCVSASACVSGLVRLLPNALAGVRALLWMCVSVCACAYHMQKLLDIGLITETLISPLLCSFLQASSALLLPFHSWTEHKNDGVSRNFFELIYRDVFPYSPPIYGSIQSVYSIRVTTAKGKSKLCLYEHVHVYVSLLRMYMLISLVWAFSCRKREHFTHQCTANP